MTEDKLLQENLDEILLEDGGSLLLEPRDVSVVEAVTISENLVIKINVSVSLHDVVTATEYSFVDIKNVVNKFDAITITESVTLLIPSVLNPTNAYASDNTYAQITGCVSGQLDISLSFDGGSTYTSLLSNTFSPADGYLSYGSGSTELWGSAITGDDVDNTSFRLKMSHNNGFMTISQVYSTFGFAISATAILTGLEVEVEAKYTSADNSIYVDNIHVKAHYGTSVLPIQAGSQVYATNGRKNGEGAGLGTGVLVFYDSTNNWIAVDTGLPVAS